MTTDQINAIEAELQSGLTLASQVAGVVAPEVVPFLVLSKAVALAFPPLANDVQALLAKQNPTQDDVSALAKSIAALQTPESL